MKIKNIYPVETEFLSVLLGDDFKEGMDGLRVDFFTPEDKELKSVIVLFTPKPAPDKSGDMILELSILYDTEKYNYEEYKTYFEEILNTIKGVLEGFIDTLKKEMEES